MTEPARLIQKIVVSRLEHLLECAILDELVAEPSRPRLDTADLMSALEIAKGEAFLAALKGDREIADLRFAADVEAERKRADELALQVGELSRSKTELAQRVQEVTNANEQMERAVTNLGEELGRTRGTLANLAQEHEKTKTERDALKAEVESMKARMAVLLAEHETRVNGIEADRGHLAEELVALKRERDENKGEKTIQQLGRLLLKPEWFARYSEEGTLPEHVRDLVERRQRFWWQENGIARLQEELGRGLTDEQRGFVEADRIQLHDKGYPKFVNRRDLVRRLRPADVATVDGLLRYRQEWDRKLAGQTVRQEIIDKLYEGMAGWKESPTINSLHMLSKACGVDRATLKKFHDMGLVDLGWCINDPKVRGRNPGPNKKRRTSRRPA